MMVLYHNSQNSWSLFLGHLVVEKLLKAFYAKENRLAPYAPRSHDLNYLSNKIGIVLNEEQENIFKKLTQFNLDTRYGNFQNNNYSKYTKEYAKQQINNIKEVREWLVNLMII